MKKEILIALIDKWHRESEPPEVIDGSHDAEIGVARDEGGRKAKRKCAQDLSTLISLLD